MIKIQAALDKITLRRGTIAGTAPTAQKAAIPDQLPIWPEPMRCIPNDLVRTAVFNAKNKKIPRVFYKVHTDVFVVGNGHVSYRGEELRQDDETVWLQMIHIGRETPLGHIIEFTPYAFCKSIRWTLNETSYARLRACLHRMQGGAIAMYSIGLDGSGKSHAMIPVFEWQNGNGEALRKYKLTIPNFLAKLLSLATTPDWYGSNVWRYLPGLQRGCTGILLATGSHTPSRSKRFAMGRGLKRLRTRRTPPNSCESSRPHYPSYRSAGFSKAGRSKKG